jgi:hypothetical protein
MLKSYVITQVDRAGNTFPIFRAETFDIACEQIIFAKRARPFDHFYLINEDRADIDYDGLTEEERELLP